MTRALDLSSAGPVGPVGLCGPRQEVLAQGRLTPGDPDMELRDPESHEDGDPEVRAGRRGKGRQRCRKTESEIDTRRDSEQTHREQWKRPGNRNIRDPE